MPKINKLYWIFFICSFLWTMSIHAQEQKNIPERNVYFNGQTYTLKTIAPDYNDYFLATESPKAWTSMLSIRRFDGYKTPTDLANNLSQFYANQGITVQKSIHKISKEALLVFYIQSKGKLELNLWQIYKTDNKLYAMQYVKAYKPPKTKQQAAELKKSATDLTYQFLSLEKQPFVQ